MKAFVILISMPFFFKAFCQADTTVNGVKYNFKSYYPNGNINELGNVIYKNGQQIKNGHWRKFDEKGKEIESGKFRKDMREGVWMEEDCKGKYRKGKKQGWWKCPSRKNKYKKGEFVEKIIIDPKVF